MRQYGNFGPMERGAPLIVPTSFQSVFDVSGNGFGESSLRPHYLIRKERYGGQDKHWFVFCVFFLPSCIFCMLPTKKRKEGVKAWGLWRGKGEGEGWKWDWGQVREWCT